MALNTNRTNTDFTFRHVGQPDKLGQSVGGVVATVQSSFDSRATDNLTDINNVKTTMRSTTVGDSGAKNIGASMYADVVGVTVQAQLEEINNKSATAFPVQDGSLGDIKLSNTAGQIKDVVEGHTAQLADIAINIKSFGAIGDGITDDSTAIQNAINYVGSLGGGTVLIPDGIYSITKTLLVKSNMRITGTGTLECTGTFPASTSLDSSALNIRNGINRIENVVIDGLTIIPPFTAGIGKSQGILVSWAENVAIRNCTFKNIPNSGIRVDGYGELYGDAGRSTQSPDYIVYTKNVYIENNTILNPLSKHGIEVIAWPDNIICTGNKVYNAYEHGIRISGAYNSIISNNVTEGCGEFGIYLAGYNLLCNGNIIDGKTTGKYGISALDLFKSKISYNLIANVRLEGINAGISDFPINNVTIENNDIYNFGCDNVTAYGIILRNEGINNCIIRNNKIVSKETTLPRGINLEKQSEQLNQPTFCLVENNLIDVPSIFKLVVLGKTSDGGTNISRLNTNTTTMKSFEKSSGIATFSGDGTTKLFRIVHGFTSLVPTRVSAFANSIDAGTGLIRFIEGNITYVDVNFVDAPITGTNNVKIIWECEV